MLGRFALCLMLVCPTALWADAPDCAAMAESVAAEYGVPTGVMAAISLVETGKAGRPWPWTLNEGGKGMHFATQAEAMAYLEQAVARGVTNIDVGCMQLNYRWHGAAFDALSQMLEPDSNIRYAARFLLELKARVGSWEQAVADYHSANPERGNAYRAKVADAMGDGPAPALADGRPAPYLAALAPSGDMAALIGASAAAAAQLFTDSPAPDLPKQTPFALRARAELPPRMQHRWQALQQIRDVLANGGS